MEQYSLAVQGPSPKRRLLMVENVQQLSIKGIRDGLLITAVHRTFDALRRELETELSARQAFLQGSRIALQVGAQRLERAQLKALKALFQRHELELWAILSTESETRSAARALDLATRLSGSQTDLDGNEIAAPAVETPQPAQAAPPGGLVLKETLRSGRSIFHEGTVVVVGDVNPGAEIIAAGDVIVWGRLRGLVHAGALGDETAVICALALNPTQLRIANQIAISPDERPSGTVIPEQASIRDGQIVAEPWQK